MNTRVQKMLEDEIRSEGVEEVFSTGVNIGSDATDGILKLMNITKSHTKTICNWLWDCSQITNNSASYFFS